MTQRRHRMPFGAEILRDGRVRFRLWAPGATGVELCLGLGASETALTMAAPRDGWFELVTKLAGSGTCYRFRIDGGLCVPDPASRFQAQDVHGHSQVIDPCAWNWNDSEWTGRPWEEAVIYELHTGTFTPEGSFAAVRERLDHLADLGVTALELMPIADFPGTRNWGYDGVLPFAPDSRYGTPEALKDLIQAAHDHDLMVILDVVYNHFGPEGNYLHAYAPQFFSERRHTPWGAAINFDGDDRICVRQYFIHNAMYWLEEYHLDGLRLDAVHAISDNSDPDILTELADTIHRSFGNDRHIHLILENDSNAARYLERDATGRPRWYIAQWNDDIHHALHVLTTGETGGYYADYAHRPAKHLGRCLTEGFAYQGEPSPYRNGRARGEPSKHLPPTAFVSFLQNHDQVGNRAFGERITTLTDPDKVRAAMAILLLAPLPPLLFMGQEWGATQPFPFFCDFGAELTGKVVEGRHREFARFPEFSAAAARRRIPDPTDPATFRNALLDWEDLNKTPHRTWLQFYRDLLRLRHREIVPRLYNMAPGQAHYRLLAPRALSVRWIMGDASTLVLLANLGREPVTGTPPPPGLPLYVSGYNRSAVVNQATLPPWSVAWFLDQEAAVP